MDVAAGCRILKGGQRTHARSMILVQKNGLEEGGVSTDGQTPNAHYIPQESPSLDAPDEAL